MFRNGVKTYYLEGMRLQKHHSNLKGEIEVDSCSKIYRMHPTATVICFEISRLNNSLGVLIVDFVVCLVDV
jgi:hypothetical protein